MRLVCNGEIDNFRELRRELEENGHRFKTGSESEAIIHGYAEWGDEFIHRLNGMFGFALWDRRRRRLLVGRDRLGIKPVYVHRAANRLAVASEAKALLTLPGIAAEIDHAALMFYLDLGYLAAPRSMLLGISKRAPASLLVEEEGRVAERRYWRIPHTTDRRLSEREWIERTRARLGDSVRMQMVSAVPPLVRALLSKAVVEERGLFHYPAVSELISSHQANLCGWHGSVAGAHKSRSLVTHLSRLPLAGRCRDGSQGYAVVHPVITAQH